MCVLHIHDIYMQAAVGITEYASTHAGFRGTLKYRYSDFIVREVSLAKEIVRLTDTSDRVSLPPDDKAAAPPAGSAEAAPAAGAGAAPATEDAALAAPGAAAGVAEMEGLVGKEVTAQILALVEKAQSQEGVLKGGDEDVKAWEVVLEPDADKAKRTAIHKCVRANFAPLESDSVKVGDVTAVRGLREGVA